MFNKVIIMTLMFLAIPTIAKATDIDTDIEGYTNLINMMKTYVRGTGGIILLIGTGDFFINIALQNLERLVGAMKLIGAGFFLILADSLIQAIAKANGQDVFVILMEMIGLVISFIGAVLSMIGAYQTFNSIKDRNGQQRSRAIKILCGGLILIALSQSVTNFLL